MFLSLLNLTAKRKIEHSLEALFPLTNYHSLNLVRILFTQGQSFWPVPLL
jgi:hypothetical protein